ncbi:hypothetical protein D3C76_666330 [compost metagenome]
MSTVPAGATGTSVPASPSAPVRISVTVRGSPSGSKAFAVASPLGLTPGVPLFTPPASLAMTTTFCATGGSFTPRTMMCNCAWSVRPAVSVIS